MVGGQTFGIFLKKKKHPKQAWQKKKAITTACQLKITFRNGGGGA